MCVCVYICIYIYIYIYIYNICVCLRVGMCLICQIQGNTEVWARELSNGSVAVALYNKNGLGAADSCTSWNHTTGGYYEACGGAGGDLGNFSGYTVAQAEAVCCAETACAGFSFSASDGSGYYKHNADCGFVGSSTYDGYFKPQDLPPTGTAVNITVAFADVGVYVRDIWQQRDLGAFTTVYTALVPLHGSAFIKLTSS